MASAAGIPDDRPKFYATDGALVVHPMFAVAPEWALLIANRSLPDGMTVLEAKRGIHVGHDVTLRRSILVGELVTLHASITAVGRRSAGAAQETTFAAVDTAGEVVWETHFSSLFLGVEYEGSLAGASTGSSVPRDSSRGVAAIATCASEVCMVDAHVDSECARIWDPIHTDVVAARAAGLTAPILHGTAMLARAVSGVVDLAGCRWPTCAGSRVDSAQWCRSHPPSRSVYSPSMGAHWVSTCCNRMAAEPSPTASSSFVPRLLGEAAPLLGSVNGVLAVVGSTRFHGCRTPVRE